MSVHLRSCGTCSRHIRITETACPFCKAAVPNDRMSPPPRGVSANRIGRAFAVSTGVAAALATAACSGNVSSGPADAAQDSPTAQDSPSAQDSPTAQPAYGVVEPEGGFQKAAEGGPDGETADGGQPDGPTAQPAYGVAEPLDGGPDVLTAADAYGTATPGDAQADVITGGQAYGLAEPDADKP